MIYFKDTTDFYVEEGTTLALGKFDGLHSGHRYLMNFLMKEKRERNLKSVIFTFERPPKDEIEKCAHNVLSTNREKEFIFDYVGVDILIECPFNDEIMHMKAEDFVKMLVDRLHIKSIIVGTDVAFGFERKGDYKLLTKMGPELGFDVILVHKKQFDGEDISSTRIRGLIEEGDIEYANELLGYEFFIQGVVSHGRHLGTTIGVPTINVIPAYRKILPPNGVYISRVRLQGKNYYGITDIGYKPTVGSNILGTETHILDFNKDVYDEDVRVHLIKRIRGEIKFDSLDALKEQIAKDEAETREYFKIVTND
ncbi:MAG: bifunctional riboflavin kinase/FAD synthetase [Lachnospiraceae bacterium]|nr:bifunctional riboflavin kinase/FAD synthetase [Lachnospiraceae bacterium]